MHIAVFGGTGRVGGRFIEYALAEGHTVRALVRDPAKLAPRPGLDVIAGDVLNPADVERRQRAIRSAGAAATQPWLANTHRTLDAAIGAQLAVARRSPTARAAVETLDSLLLDTPNLERRGVRTTGNMVLASLWERLGESQLAIRAANRRDGQSGYGMYHAERLRIVARSARALGQADVERAALQEFVDMRGVAEPALQPEVERFRARLAELNAQAAR